MLVFGSSEAAKNYLKVGTSNLGMTAFIRFVNRAIWLPDVT